MGRSAALLALLFLGCESQTVSDYARLRGLTDMERVGRYIFVVSSHNSELRVLDSEADVLSGRENPGFVRAPNPLALLSIPVLDRPVSLSADVHFTEEGEEVRGPYLYVQGSGAREISVVGADPSLFMEAARLTTSGPVTALTGIGPASEGEESTLIYAETAGGAARLFSARLAGPEALTEAPAAVPVRLEDGTPTYWPGETVAAMLTLPRAEDGSLRIVVAFRSERGESGRTELLTLDPQGQAYVAPPVSLDFGGPVRLLRTHPRVTRVVGEGEDAKEEQTLPAGARVFGALDETRCETSLSCGGIVAVDAITLARESGADLTLGQRSIDGTGLPMAAIQTDGEFLMDFELLPGLLRIPLLGATVGQRLDLGGVISTGYGAFQIFDASALQVINTSTDRPSIVRNTLGYYDADSTLISEVSLTGTLTRLVDSSTLVLNHGVVRDEVISLAFMGDVPGLRSLELGPDGPVSLTASGLQLGNPALLDRLRVGDRVRAEGESGCPERLRIDALDAVTGEVDTSPIPTEACRLVTFQAEAVETPWVVSGGSSGWLGRTAAGEHFVSVPGVPFAHTPHYDPAAPQMAFDFVLPSSLVPQEGQSLRFRTLDGVVAQQARTDPRPQFLGIDSTVTPPGALVLLPPSLDFPYGSVWAAFPSRNLILAFPPISIVPNKDLVRADVLNFQ